MKIKKKLLLNAIVISLGILVYVNKLLSMLWCESNQNSFECKKRLSKP
jgi:hypothetical protein